MGYRFYGPFAKSYGNQYILVVVEYVSSLKETQALLTNYARIVVKFMKKLFSRFCIPWAIISDRGIYLCKQQLEKVLKYIGLTQKIAIPYYPRTSGQVEVANRERRWILEKVRSHPRGLESKA